MNFEQAMVSHLKNNAALSALIAGRIYPGTYPQGATLPVVVYQRASRVPEYTHDGPSGLTESRYQISSFAKTYPEATNVATKLEAAFNPWMVNQVVVGGVHIGATFLETDFHLVNDQETEALSDQQILGEYLFLHGEGN